MINPIDTVIRVYVGELIEDDEGFQYLITGLDRKGKYSFICLNSGFSEKTSWETFKLCHRPKKRLGIVNGIELLEGEDWICHDKRCYPGVLADGCSGCMYQNLSRERKRYYEPGDTIWIPTEKKKRVIAETQLFYSHEKGGAPFKVDSVYNLGRIYDLIFSVRFRLEVYPVNGKYYRWDELRLVKRKRHFINLPQLDHICNDLCLFGPYNKIKKRCFGCETGKIWREATTV